MEGGAGAVRRMRSLGELLEGLVDRKRLGQHGPRLVSGVFDDSRRVEPDGVFVAVQGARVDGRMFAEDAARRGAAVLVGEWSDGTMRVDDPSRPGSCCSAAALGRHGAANWPASDSRSDPPLVLDVPDARSVLARLASRWHGLEQARQAGFRLAGVTGTNGKSTTAFMTRAMLVAAGRRCGLLGTVQYDLCARCVAAPMTTPGALDLSGYLRECVDAGASAAVMEVSSHALAQKRTDGMRFDAAAFTNLSGDHLDYHGTMEAYRAAKARLFRSLDPSAVAVLNRDDQSAMQMLEGSRARVVFYSLCDGGAEISARITRETITGTHYVMRIDGQSLGLENAVVGRHNVYNAMAAAGLARALMCGTGVPPVAILTAIAEGLSSVRNVPGRLQRVPGARGSEPQGHRGIEKRSGRGDVGASAPGDVGTCAFDVFVDYAHTDDALRNVLSVLRPLARRRLIVVFGCGGDRDKTKRPRMGRVAAEAADAVVVTSDNPRCEDPRAIIDEILAGIDASDRRRVMVEADRRSAIHGALAGAGAGDVVLIAGKGHEDYQIIGERRIHFDDVETAIEALAALAAAGR